MTSMFRIVLKTVCTFYDADWAGLLELDLELGVTTTGWQYHAESKPVMPHKMQEFENIYPMKTWLNALKSGEPIIILDLPSIAKALPQEYQAYKRMGTYCRTFRTESLGLSCAQKSGTIQNTYKCCKHFCLCTPPCNRSKERY